MSVVPLATSVRIFLRAKSHMVPMMLYRISRLSGARLCTICLRKNNPFCRVSISSFWVWFPFLVRSFSLCAIFYMKSRYILECLFLQIFPYLRCMIRRYRVFLPFFLVIQPIVSLDQSFFLSLLHISRTGRVFCSNLCCLPICIPCSMWLPCCAPH